MTGERGWLLLTGVPLIVSLALLAAGRGDAAAWVAAIGPALLVGPLAWRVGRSLLRREHGVDIVALLALAGALLAGETLAGAIIAVMLTGGEWLEAAAAGRAARDLTALLRAAPRLAHRVGSDGGLVTVPAEDVQPSWELLVKPGEQVPVDGTLRVAGTFDESTLTGEARPVRREPGDRVASGVTNVGGDVRMAALATAADSTYAGIVRLVEEARAARSPMTRLADRYASWFVPLTLAVAGAAWLLSADPVRALAVLVVATPCPLLLATPIAIVSGISRAAHHGVIVKSGGELEAMATAQTVCFDKTGTLTTGRPRVTSMEVLAEDAEEEVRWLAASLEQSSAHPFAASIVAHGRDPQRPLALPTDVHESAGDGVRGVVGDRRVAVGSLGWVVSADAMPAAAWRIHAAAQAEGHSTAWVAVDDHLAAAIHLADPLRPEAGATVEQLRGQGVRRVVMLTGDVEAVGSRIGEEAAVDEVLADRTPAQKVDAVRLEAAAAGTVMVGDGVNDAPALAAATVGVAMGARGATAAGEAAGMVITADQISSLADARAIAAGTMRIARQSALVGMGLSLVAMAFAAGGALSPVAGAVLQEGIDLASIANALRALRVRP